MNEILFLLIFLYFLFAIVLCFYCNGKKIIQFISLILIPNDILSIFRLFTINYKHIKHIKAVNSKYPRNKYRIL
jgi:hypothetical protein